MDEPLHVQVARALGWEELHPESSSAQWFGVEPYGGLKIAVPAYDRSWCSMGVLIERFRFFLSPWQEGTWEAVDSLGDFKADGKTPCEAAAQLILTLNREGKLPA